MGTRMGKVTKHAMVFGLFWLGLQGCTNTNNIDGSLQVNSAFSINDSNKKANAVPVGTYSTSLDVDKNGKFINFVVKLPSGDVTAKLNIPAGAILSAGTGDITIKGSDNNQSFDLKADSSTNTTSTGQQSGVESCTYYTTQYSCWQEPVTSCYSEKVHLNLGANNSAIRVAANVKPLDDDDHGKGGDGDDHGGGRGGGDGDDHGGGDRGGGGDGDDHGGGGGDNDNNPPQQTCTTTYQQECGDTQVANSGTQSVVYHYVTTTQGSTANVLDAKTQAVLAVFTSSNASTSKVYDSQGDCD